MSTLVRTSRVLAGAAAAAALTISVTGLAGASTTIVQTSTPVTATSNYLQITAGAHTLECYSVSGSGTTPASGSNVNSGTGGIDIPISSVNLSSCYLDGGVSATVTATQPWKINVSADSGSPKGSLIMPDNSATVVGTDGCQITLMQSNIGPLPYNKPNVTASSAPGIKFLSNGVGVCPAATGSTPASGTLTGTLKFSPGIDVTT